MKKNVKINIRCFLTWFINIIKKKKIDFHNCRPPQHERERYYSAGTRSGENDGKS